jgi:hypothetical protein
MPTRALPVTPCASLNLKKNPTPVTLKQAALSNGSIKSVGQDLCPPCTPMPQYASEGQTACRKFIALLDLRDTRDLPPRLALATLSRIVSGCCAASKGNGDLIYLLCGPQTV